MDVKSTTQTRHALRIALSSLVLFQLSVGPVFAAAASPSDPGLGNTITPIKHVIVIIGENRSFDHVFATYEAPKGEHVDNLLSKGIIELDANKNARPGPHFDRAQQLSAADLGSTDSFLLSPPKQKFPDDHLPAPLVGGPSGANGYFSGSNPCGTQPALSALECARLSETGLADSYYQDLVSGGTQEKSHTFLSDVAAAQLQRGRCHPVQSVRMRRETVFVGRGHGRRGRERRRATRQLQHGICAGRGHDR
jgi:phospholipase C